MLIVGRNWHDGGTTWNDKNLINSRLSGGSGCCMNDTCGVFMSALFFLWCETRLKTNSSSRKKSSEKFSTHAWFEFFSFLFSLVQIQFSSRERDWLTARARDAGTHTRKKPSWNSEILCINLCNEMFSCYTTSIFNFFGEVPLFDKSRNRVAIWLENWQWRTRLFRSREFHSLLHCDERWRRRVWRASKRKQNW